MSVCVSGQTLSTAMVNAGLTTFSKIEQINPRELELVSHVKWKLLICIIFFKNLYVVYFLPSDCQQTSTFWQPNQRVCHSSPQVWSYFGTGKNTLHNWIFNDQTPKCGEMVWVSSYLSLLSLLGPLKVSDEYLMSNMLYLSIIASTV